MVKCYRRLELSSYHQYSAHKHSPPNRQHLSYDNCLEVCAALYTSVSETIRKPLLLKAQTAFKKQKNRIWRKKRLPIWRTVFLHPAMWHDYDSDFARWLQTAMWHVALKSWQWIHQVATPCNVIRGSGLICNWIRPNAHHIEILHLVSISTTSPQSICRSAPVCEILSKLDHPQQNSIDVMSIFKMADLSHLGFQGSNNRFFEKPMYDFL